MAEIGQWYMMTVIGKDRPGIVAAVTQVLFNAGCHLGETSMMRLGGYFTMMLMVGAPKDEAVLRAALEPVTASWQLRLHFDAIEGRLHQHVVPDVRITVSGADRPGIVAEVTAALARIGFNILDLESDVAGRAESPIYIMHIEGCATQGIDALAQALRPLQQQQGIDLRWQTIATLLG